MARLELIVDASQAARGFRQAEQGSDRYQRSARETIRRNQRLKDSFSRIRQNVFNLRNAMIGLAGAGAMGAVIQRTLASTAAISEQADVAGVSVEKFQELTKAFSDMAGVQESITSGALRRFNRRFGLAQEGMGAANNTLDRLNISLEQGTGPALEEAITKLASMENGANRTAEASQLFGEDAGPRLAAALAQGGDALDETIQKLREQGRIMSGESVEAARDFNDRFNELKDTLTTNFARAIANNADSIEAVAEAIIKAGSAAKEYGQAIGETIAQLGGNFAGEEDIRQRISEIDRMIEERQNRGTFFNFMSGNLGAFTKSNEELRAEREQLRSRLDLLDSLADRPDQGGSGSGRIEFMGELNRQLAFMERQVELTDDQVKELVNSGWGKLGELPSILEATANAESAIADARQRDIDATLNSSFGRDLARAGELPNILEATRNAERALDRLNEKAEESSNEMSEFARSAAQNMQSAFADFLFDPMEKGFDGLAESFARTIQRMIAEAAAAEILDSFANNSGSGSGDSAASGFGAMLSRWIANSADGNVFTGPSMTTVSERGHPEAVLPLERQNGKLGVRASGGEGGGQTIVNVRNESGGQAEVSRRSSGRDQIVDILIPAVQSGIQSGRLDGPMRERFGITPGTRGR